MDVRPIIANLSMYVPKYEQCHAHRQDIICLGLVPKIEMSRVQKRVGMDTGVWAEGAKRIKFQPGVQNASFRVFAGLRR